ncbi:MAG: tRNA-dihydrouridine synthase family protein [Bdellovibrionales bacterium]|nr:tRNA-dihydrouridine synthase family protein [Bdellovibrionales bacterium]
MDLQQNDHVNLFLAPMEGITHGAFREKISSMGGVDFCVTEFMRVTQQIHPKKVFYRFCPELKKYNFNKNNSLDSSDRLATNPFDFLNFKQGPLINKKTPILIQFLGADSELLLQNSLRAIELGAKGIDLNFGCPAKVVNRHMGGAFLLQFPNLIGQITKFIRSRLPVDIKVSAKIRLGFNDTSLIKDITQALDESNIDWLTVHCRTKKNGYAPPAYWEYIPTMKQWTNIPIIANGDIFSVEDLLMCYKQTKCTSFMIGRGIIFNPFLFTEVRGFLNKFSLNENISLIPKEEYKIPLTPELVLKTLVEYFILSENEVNEYYATAKVKGWLKTISIKNSHFKVFFNKMKVLKGSEFKKELFKEFYETNSKNNHLYERPLSILC